ncbi:MAG: transposase [Opitutales bacterium]|nr:transposase [Opitutales bacterium]
MRYLIPKKSCRLPRAGRKGVDGVHHVVSRVCGREFLLTDVEKEAFRGLLKRVAGFCGVEVITFALLDNHFHLLIEVPGKPGELSDEALLARARLLYGRERKGQPLSMARIEAALRAGGEIREAMRGLLMGRMASLPMFMKILKQRYSILFNRKYDRVGTLWEGRFRSVLVENTRVAVRAVAAYIDLNPVRAGIVDDPKDYRFSGYGEAIGSGKLREYALWRRIADNRSDPPEIVAARYRQYLYVAGSDPRKGHSLAPKERAKVMETSGSLSTAEKLRCRLRFMTQGVAIGTKAFVEEWLRGGKEMAASTKKKPPSTADGFDNEGLFVAGGRNG